MNSDKIELNKGIGVHSIDSSGMLMFEPGVHCIDPDILPEDFRYISNNDDGMKRIFCNLEGCDDVIIDGAGAELRFSGRIVPFYFRNCRNITLRNFKIDWERPFLTQGRIIRVHDDYLDMEFPDDQPVKVKNQKLCFFGRNYETDYIHNMLEFNPNKKETEYKAQDHYGICTAHRAEELGDGVFRLYVRYRNMPKVGNLMVFKHEKRLSPGIIVEKCTNVKLENIDIYHCGGMAMVAQASRDIYLKRVNIIPRPGSGRIFSVHADATHFVDCEGDIFLEQCRCENQMDDPVNIHGIFRPVEELIAPDSVRIRLIHKQQLGVDTIRSGDMIGFYDRKSFELKYQAVAIRVERINSEYTELFFNERLPLLDWTNIAVMKQCHDVNVKIKACRFSGNRARGLLISSLGQILIEDNYFHTPGAAVRISGDIDDWFESGPVENVEIRNNFFDNCCYGVWGDALIDVVPQVKTENQRIPVHSNISIHDNIIKYIHKPLLTGWCVENIEFYDNELVESSDYPHSGQDKELFDLRKIVKIGRLQDSPALNL
jgi:hypothetical protein